ncbi:hypothetical protein BIWAKO_02871 [Bosea sp. BIWAKO-01]|nr:hypothetical protein BIWAKO_02871 [Bosea sp. BIWAKO-01]
MAGHGANSGSTREIEQFQDDSRDGRAQLGSRLGRGFQSAIDVKAGLSG